MEDTHSYLMESRISTAASKSATSRSTFTVRPERRCPQIDLINTAPLIYSRPLSDALDSAFAALFRRDTYCNPVVQRP